MRVGFAKLGRSVAITPDDFGFVGGDFEPISALTTLARARPQDTFFLTGCNSGEDPAKVGLPSNIVNPWLEWGPEIKRWKKNNPYDYSYEWADRFLDGPHAAITLPFLRDLDAHILWIGQHGSTNNPIPVVNFESQKTSPFLSFLNYVGFYVRGINAWRDQDPVDREEIYLNSDPRNTLKWRDTRWPLMNPVLAQYNYTNRLKHYRYGDPAPLGPPWDKWTEDLGDGSWHSEVDNVYARLECCGVLPGTVIGDHLAFDDTWEDRESIGVIVNEARWYNKPGLNRLEIMRDWVMPLEPSFIHGVWHPYSVKKLGLEKIDPLHFTKFNDKYHSVRCTFTTPSSGSGWATTKIWESMACGTVCFMHYHYDNQNNIFKDADPHLNEYLRVKTPQELADRVDEMNHDRDHWKIIVKLQREHYEKAARERQWLRMVEERLD